MSNPIYHRVLVAALLLLLLTSSLFTQAANISAKANGNWNSTSSWSTGTVPAAGDNVTIAGHTITVNVTNAASATLTITSGTLNISNGDKLTIGGALTNAGTITATGSLLIGGSLTNSGTMNVTGTLTFDGAANSTISSSSGVYTISGTVVLNMGSATTALDVQDPNFISGINSGGKYYFTFTRGTFRMDNSGTLNNAYNSGSGNALTIPNGVVLESDNGTMNLATKGTTGNVLLSGQLFVNGGTVNVQMGQTSSQDFQYSVSGGTPQLYVSGGTLNIGSGFNPKGGGDYIDFHMTLGTILVTSQQPSANATFQLQNVTGGKTFMSGGRVILEQPGTGSNPDLDMGGSSISPYSVTGGTVQLGTSTMPSSGNFFGIMPYSTTNYPNIDIEPGTPETVAAHAVGNFNFLSLYINSKGTLDASSMTTVTITSSTGSYAFDDEGTFTPGNNTVVFSGGVSQMVTSSSLSNVSFYNLKVANTNGNVVLGVPTTVTNQLSFTSGDLDASADPLTISNGSVAITGTGNGSYVITGNGVTGTGYLAIQKLPKNTGTLFPIGTPGYYLPATINPGANGNTSYTAYVYPGVTTNALENGTSVSAPVLSTMADGTWNIARTAGSGTASLLLNWVSAGTAMEGTAFQMFGTNIGITQFSGSSWGMATGSGNVGTGTATASFGSFGEFSVIGTPIALPIVLGNFDAMPQGKTAYLTWAAYPDGQAAAFTIERSVDGVSWTSIGAVQADVTATTETSYSFTDVAPAVGQDDYRLYIQNQDGSTSYSSIRAVEFASLTSLSIYPNPANAALTINAAAGSGNVANSGKRLVFRLVNTAGQVLQSKVIEAGGASVITMATGSYPAGVYYVEMLEGEQVLQTLAVMIMH